jgi:hypothetical protein
MLKGATLQDMHFELFVLSMFLPLYALLALSRFRRTLD